MQNQPPVTQRLNFVEGLKGLAAMQVVCLHYLCAFFPALGRAGETKHAWETWIAASPLFILYDGYASYNLFFLMSGFVLAPSFAKISGGWMNQAARRLFRLFLPMAAAFLIAVLLFLIFPNAKEHANVIARSGWLENSANSPMTFAALAKDLFLNSMIAGYREKSLFAAFPYLYQYLSTWGISINGPFWTLHIILWGSYLILAMAWLRRRTSKRVFYVASAAVFLVTSTSGFSLFLIGYLFYDLFTYVQAKPSRAITMIGVLCLLAGLFLVYTPSFPALEPAYHLQNIIRSGPTTYNEWLEEVGAVSIFAGILMLAPVAKFLSASVFLYLGRISFSLFLTHFPILFTVSCTVFVLISDWGLGYEESFLMTWAIGIGLSLLVAHIFEKKVELPCIALTKRLFSPQTNKPTLAVN